MEEIIDMIFNDASASKITDGIKDALYSKSAEKIDQYRPLAASSLFGGQSQPEPEGEE